MKNLSTHGFAVLSIAMIIIVFISTFNFLADQNYRADQLANNEETKQARIQAQNERVSLANLVKVSNARDQSLEKYMIDILTYMNESQARTEQLLPDWNDTLHAIRDNQKLIGQYLNISGIR